MSLTIYHNPRCSKSRKTLELIQDAGVSPAIVEYLNAPPAAERVLELATLLGLSVRELLRRNEAEFKGAAALPDLDDDAALAQWIAANPKVLERPIVVDDANGIAVIGRPPENVAKLLP
ncbi:MAG: arsenate reductase (glutaredoxin) [Gammaproteobacteria bacterium]|nr:arsenate reductase (glutaredoxin) [Gammaproteobacteria bacterium]